jgi:hypothetical protein
MQFLKQYKIGWILLFIQAILCIIAFNKFWINPSDFMFMGVYDGIKNYFTFQSYISQSPESGMSLVTGHAYPYGDYLFYADLTPSIAVPLRLFSVYIYDISPHAIPIFNFIIIFLHFISVLFVYKILKNFVQTPWILWLLSISLSWVHPQFFRMMNGHFNLSISLFILLTILSLIHIYKGYQNAPEQYFSSNKKRVVGLFFLLYVASFTHLYYLPILGVSIGSFAFFYFLQLKIYNQESWKNSLRPLLLLSFICFLGLVAVLGTIQLVDTYYDLRSVGNAAYGANYWKMSLSSLITARKFNYIGYLFSYSGQIKYESNLYMGAFFLYSLTLLLVLSFNKGENYLSLKKALSQQPILILFLLVGFVGLFISMGDVYLMSDGSYQFNNYLNPFFYLRVFASQVEQFRCLARFFWPTFWLFSFLMAYIVDYYWRNHKNKAVRFFFGAFVLFSVVDAKDAIQMQNRTYSENAFNSQRTTCNKQLFKDINTDNYQALLPLPYFNVGSEVWGLVIDGGRLYNRMIFGTSLCTNLPMMSIQSSRLPVQHTKDFFSIFLKQRPNKSLVEKLNEKPILVLYHKEFHEKTENFSDFSYTKIKPGKTVLERGALLPETYRMKKLGEDSEFILYEWDIKNIKSPKPPKEVITITCDTETLKDKGVKLATSDTSLVVAGGNLRSKKKKRSGEYSMVLNSGTPYGYGCELLDVQEKEVIVASVWRHKDAQTGALVLEAEDYYSADVTLVKEEGDWQLIEQEFIAIPKINKLKIYYWNQNKTSVWLDDFKIVRKRY